MKKQLGYSEFSFGYAFTENLVRSSAAGPPAAPRFPNLQEEGQLGYDVQLTAGGVPLFLQFKLPERMVRTTAAEISKYGLNRSGLSTPFFRLYLMKRNVSRQHELLIEIEQKEPGSVFYAMPHLVGPREFSTAYAAMAVHRHSVLFSPCDIGPLRDDAQHTVAYDPRSRGAWFCSEPKLIEAHDVVSVLAERGRAASEQVTGGLAAVARAISGRILSTRPGELDDVAAAARERRRRIVADSRQRDEAEEAVEELFIARELARIGLGVELLIAQPRPATATR